MVGSLTGAVASQKVTEACEGRLKLVGNQLLSAMAPLLQLCSGADDDMCRIGGRL